MSTAPCESIDAERIRREFPIFDRPLPNGRPLVYLDSAASAQKPRRVIEKERECYERYYANAYRGDYQFGVHVDEELEATRTKVRDFIGAAEPEEILFTSGTTMSINLVAQAWGRKFLAKGDEILLTQMEHHANLVPWQQVAREKGAELRFVRLRPDGLLDLDHLDELLNDRTRIVAITGMSNVLGTAPATRGNRQAGQGARRRWCSSTARKACRIWRPTSARWGSTSWPSPGTSCMARPASASFTAAGRCWRRWTRSSAAGT